MKSIPNAEQETTISFGREDDIAVIWTSDKTMMNKLDKLVENDDSPWKCVDVGRNDEYGVLCKEYRVPKKLISFRSRTTTREMTEEQKQRSAEALRLYRENQRKASLKDN